MGSQFLRPALAARSGAAASGPGSNAVWVKRGEAALSHYIRWRKLTPEERRELQEGALTAYAGDCRQAILELYESMKHGDGERRIAAAKTALTATQALLDAIVVKFGLDGDWGVGRAVSLA
jgi:hypothetical protein